MTLTSPTPERLATLRSAFDLSFAEPPRPTTAEVEDLLTVQVAGTPYAIRIAAIAGLFAGRAITPVPSPVPEFLGVAGFRGSIIAVYDLGALLGYGPTLAPRWLVLDAGTPPVAMAFDSIDGYLRAPAGSIALATSGEPASGGTRAASHEVVQTPDGMRPIVGIRAVRAEIEARTREFDRHAGDFDQDGKR